MVVACIFILRKYRSSFLKRELTITDIICNRIQTGSTCHQRFFRYMRLQQNMTHLDSVTTFFHQLDNVETILRFYNLRDLIGVLQIKSHIGKCGVQISTSCKWHFTTIDSRTAVVRIQTC